MVEPSKNLHERLLLLRDRVFASWLKSVQKQVKCAHGLPAALLLDTLPIFYEQLCSVASGETFNYRQSTLASEHGGERARLTNYNVETVAHEVQLFRSVLFATWGDAGFAISREQAARLNSLIDEAIRESITGFILSKAAMREQFSTAVVHDLRTQLSVASMAVDHIREAQQIDRSRELATFAAEHLARIASMLTEMLDMSMVTPPASEMLELQWLDLREVIMNVIERTPAAARTDIIGVAVQGFWHRDSISKAIEHIVSNAIAYSNPGSPITAKLQCYGGRVAVSIINEGPPIPPNRIEAIFQLYKRTALKGEGAWEIGLPFARSIAEQHAGSIAVECRHGYTTFILDVPIDPRPILMLRMRK
ncbi:HAMP domain-containing sensor histidine kinase [Massilia sp. METH4]|uniref:sensor histidine kinase n=1 Tax=Massilia sp. METH4 TaxID=3123041 RepID=UPI0030D2AC3E